MVDFEDDGLGSALAFRDLNTSNALSDVLSALTHLDALVDTVFGNVSKHLWVYLQHTKISSKIKK